jgi:hypothetical protein
MNKSTTVVFAAVLALGVGTAIAQDAAPADGGARAEKMRVEFEKRFDAADANHDGKLSREEAAAMPRLAQRFDEIDAAKTGFITKQQVGAYMKAHAGERRGKRPSGS